MVQQLETDLIIVSRAVNAKAMLHEEACNI